MKQHINDNIKFLERLKQGFKRTVSWNKYRSAIKTQSKNINLDYMIDLTFRKKNINRLFVFSLENDGKTFQNFLLIIITCY